MQDIDIIRKWIADTSLTDVECIVPDMNGVVRGKVWPAATFADAAECGALRMPSSVFAVTLTGRYAVDRERDPLSVTDPDISLRPDARSRGVKPSGHTPTGFVFADAYRGDGTPVEVAPRQVLKGVLQRFDEMDWRIVVAPELEFYLTDMNTDPAAELVAPAGRSKRAETVAQPYGLDAVNDHQDLIADVYLCAAAAGLKLGTMIHESGRAQLEINFHHGDPVHLADQVIVFKRIVRQAALRHGVQATFMAKPMATQPGSSMHVHASAVDRRTGRNAFADEDGGMTPSFRHFVGGLQRYLPEAAALFAPNVNSFRRMRPSHSAPINVQWSRDNRSCGLRVPASDPASARIENRLPGADANPYLALAATLCCGYIGVRDRLEPTALLEGSAYLQARTLPRTLDEALDRLGSCREVIDLLGEGFVRAFLLIKAAELNAYHDVVSPWEREHLQLTI